MSLMLHAGGHVAGFEEVCAVPVPEKTASYQPVANRDLINLVQDRVVSVLDMGVRSAQYGLSQKGQQFFGVMGIDTGNDDKSSCLSIGLRNSYNKSISVGIASGRAVFVCDNLCFDGDSLRVLRKHTSHVWRDLTLYIDQALRDSVSYAQRMAVEAELWQGVELSTDEGFQLLGMALGHNVLKPQQASIAIGDWRTPRHEEFAPRNAWSLYNCVTEGLKKGTAGSRLDTHTVAHDWFRQMFTDTTALPELPQA